MIANADSQDRPTRRPFPRLMNERRLTVKTALRRLLNGRLQCSQKALSRLRNMATADDFAVAKKSSPIDPKAADANGRRRQFV